MIKSKLLSLAFNIAERELSVSVDALGRITVAKAVEARVRATQRTYNQYYVRLQADLDERASLCKLLLISESWFGREIEPLNAALSLLRQKKEKIRILSIPCARGEEPITALTLALAAGFSLSNIEIEGYDVSSEAIAQANTFSFTTPSFRVLGGSFEKALFEQTGKHYVLKTPYQERLSLKKANLLDPTWAPQFAEYDLVLCRNLLVHLDTAQRTKLMQKVSRYVSHDGILLVGAIEAPILLAAGFSPIAPSAPLFKASSARVVKLSTPTAPQKTTAILSKSYPAGLPSPEEVRHLATTGRIEAAKEYALNLLELTPQSAELHYLLSFIARCSGQSREAEQWINRALRLGPENQDANHSLQPHAGEAVQ